MSDDLRDEAESAFLGRLADFAVDKIPSLIDKFRNNELDFVTDSSNLQRMEAAEETGEYAFYKEFDIERDYRVLVRTGIALREAAEDGDVDAVSELRDNTIDAYDVDGLHFAQCVQSRIPRQIYSMLVDAGLGQDEINERMSYILNNLEEHVNFIDSRDDLAREARVSIGRIRRYDPDVYVVAGSGQCATDAAEVASTVLVNMIEYDVDEKMEDHVFMAFFTHIDGFDG